MSDNWCHDLLVFYKHVMQDVMPSVPTLTDDYHKELGKSLISEEIQELFTAVDAGDMVGIADGIVDSIWVLLALATVHGINTNPLWDEVYGANMRKRGGNLRSDGKRLKPDGWMPPRIDKLLYNQGWKEGK